MINNYMGFYFKLRNITDDIYISKKNRIDLIFSPNLLSNLSYFLNIIC